MPDPVESYHDHAYQNGWHRGYAAGFATAAFVAMGCIFVLLAFDTFDKPVQGTQIKGKK